MNCRGKICNRAVFSSSVTVSGGTVIINIPQRSFNNGEHLCLFVVQNVPTTAPIGAPVVITIGADTTLYPVVKCNCEQVTACGIRSRTRYPMRVVTTATGANFKILKNLCCSPQNVLASIPATTTAAAAATTARIKEVKE